MIRKIKTGMKHPLVSGSFIMFSGSLVSNLFNFFYNLYMTRSLSVENYGILASLISLIFIYSLAAESFTPTIVHFIGSLIAKQNERKAAGLFVRFIKIFFLMSVVFGGGMVVFSGVISDFFNIHAPSLVILVAISVFLVFLSTVNKALLQAKLEFIYLSIVNISTSIIKLVMGVILVYSGYKVFGAVLAFAFSSVLFYIMSLFPIRGLISKQNEDPHVSFRDLLAYGGPSSIASIGLTLFITVDLILIKHFYDPRQAGLYAGLSLLGRVIYFFTAPIGTVMFPLIVQRYSRGEQYKNIFMLSLIIVFLFSGLLTLFYFLFPVFLIKFFLKQTDFLAIKQYVGIFAVEMMVYSLLTILVNYFLSIKKTIIFLPIAIAVILQTILIMIYHKTFLNVILESLGVISALFVLLLLYYGIIHRKK